MKTTKFVYCSEPVESNESKIMLNEIYIKGQAMDSDEDGNVDHLSPQTLLETPDSEMQYSLKPSDGKLNYKSH